MNAPANAFVQVEALTKRYGRQRGIDDVTFALNEGEILGFLGPNGAGKTTTLRTLLGLLRPTSGSATIGGFDCWREAVSVHKLVGYLPGEFSFESGMTGAQILAYLGNLRGGVDARVVDELVERFDLDPSKRFREYSRGNKQKIGLIQAFMHRPRLLILDEPTSGLDPLIQQVFYALIREARDDGRSVLLSSHVLPEVEHTCTRVAIIREGQLLRVDSVASLRDLHHHVVTVTFAAPASPDWFKGAQSVTAVEQGTTPTQLELHVQGDLQAVLRLAAAHDAINLASHEASLEDIFLRYYTAHVPGAVAPVR